MTTARWSLLVLAVCAGSGFALASDVRAATPPNIVLVIGDDHAWTDAGFMGHPQVRTPTLDALAAGGTVFTNVQLPASTCRPSLQTLLSGLHPTQWRAKKSAIEADSAMKAVIPTREEVVHYRTLPRELARRGYRSWQGGKMWEGSFAQAGFDAGSAPPGPFGPYQPSAPLGRENWDPERCGATRTRPDPCPALADLGRFLDGVGDAPFFLWFAPMLPHAPFDPPQEFTALYTGLGLDRDHVLYYAQVTRLDAVIAELLRELETRDLRRETLVIYVSDNGWQVGQGRFVRRGHGKATLHELGTRTPVIFHWPGHVPPGVRLDALVSSEALFPTILDYAGARQLPDRRGASLKPAIESGRLPGLDRYVSYYKSVAPANTGWFVRTPDWRYTSAIDGSESLYRIREDPLEATDVAADNPALLARFREDVRVWRAGIAEAPPRLDVSGVLRDAQGTPIPGVGLILVRAGGRFETRTDTRGAFVFQDLPHGKYRLEPGVGLARLTGDVRVELPVGPAGAHLPNVVGERIRVGNP